MIFDTTLENKDNEALITDIVGHRFSFFESIKMKGVGSKRMIVDKLSPNLNYISNITSDINYANIELRKKGILIHITKGLKNFTWAIPF